MVPVGTVQVETGEARRETRDDERSDADTVLVEHDGQVGDAVKPCLVEHGSRRFTAADDDQEVGFGWFERTDAEIGEHVPDGSGERSAAGVVVQGDPQARSSDVEGPGVDHRAAGEQGSQDVMDVGLQVRHVRANQPAQLLDVADAVEQAQERTKPRLVVDDDAGGGAHLEVGGVAAEQRRAGTDGRPQDHRPIVTHARATDEPTVHILCFGWVGSGARTLACANGRDVLGSTSVAWSMLWGGRDRPAS
jgi:hypothetical protein